MSYVETDLRREVLLACNKARASMPIEDIVTALADISAEIENAVNPPPPPDPPPDGNEDTAREQAILSEINAGGA